MNFHVGKRRSVATVLGALAVLGVGLVLAFGVRSVVADPNSGPAGSPPNPGHSWSEIGDLPGTMWHSNNDGAGSGLDADLLDGLDSTAFSTGPHTTSLPWTSITSKPAGFADDVDDDILGGLSCANGQIAKWDGSAWQCAADDTGAGGGYWTQAGLDLYPNNPNWNVGVGTTSPSHKLTITSADESPDEYALRLIGPDSLGHGARLNFGDGDYVYIEEDEDDRLYLYSPWRIALMGGNVGIGTSSPDEKLHVSGTVKAESTDARAVEGYTSSDNEWVSAIYGRNEGNGDGVYGWSQNRHGTVGVTQSSDPEDAGVWAFNDGPGPAIKAEGDGYFTGNVGVGTSSPDARLHVVAGTAYDDDGVRGEASAEDGFGVMGMATGPYGVGVYAEGPASGEALRAYSSGGRAIWATTDADYTAALLSESGGPNGWAAWFHGNVLITDRDTGATVIELGKGLDYGEGFNVSDEAGIGPGTVLVIDAENPGELAISEQAYDPKVAGVVSGANGLDSAIRLGGDQFDYTVALAGRVYCNVDASYGEVSPGDLLTTSPTPGYAMVVKDYSKAQGAILGKAMEGLGQGEQGQILILVTLQ